MTTQAQDATFLVEEKPSQVKMISEGAGGVKMTLEQAKRSKLGLTQAASVPGNRLDLTAQEQFFYQEVLLELKLQPRHFNSS